MTAAAQKHSIGTTLDAILGRLSYDEEFAKSLGQNASAVLDDAGLLMEKESIEQFMKAEPQRFDLICDRLAELISPDTLANITAPTCA
ncbi:MAG TPA: hypothetical protein VGX49_07300 [Jatrophihabitans sp.]|jgi:hypothetical protein|nr:hypothetical protein [Jatrophihabitans sp.]